MKLDWSHWFYALGKTVIGGVASTAAAWAGTKVMGEPLDWSQLGSVMLAATLLHLFFYLKKSPLPDDSDSTA